MTSTSQSPLSPSSPLLQSNYGATDNPESNPNASIQEQQATGTSIDIEADTFTTNLDLVSFKDEQAKLESLDNLTGDDLLRPIARNILRVLTASWVGLVEVLSASKSLTFLIALFSEPNHQLHAALRYETNEIFKRLAAQLTKNESLEDNDLTVINKTIRHLLALLVMFDPIPGETYDILSIAKDTNAVSTQEYKVTAIECTPRIIREDKNRVFSYGFSPTNNHELSSYLVHKGTGHPTGQGVDLQDLQNFIPFGTPGTILLKTAKAEIDKWIAQQTSVIVTGQSLGGAMALQSELLEANDKISEIDAFNPPGVTFEPKASEGLIKPTIFINQGDTFSRLGYFPLNAQALINDPAVKEYENGPKFWPLFCLLAHLRITTTAQPHQEIMKKDIASLNGDCERKTVTFFIYQLMRTILFIPKPLTYALNFSPASIGVGCLITYNSSVHNALYPPILNNIQDSANTGMVLLSTLVAHCNAQSISIILNAVKAIYQILCQNKLEMKNLIAPTLKTIVFFASLMTQLLEQGDNKNYANIVFTSCAALTALDLLLSYIPTMYEILQNKERPIPMAHQQQYSKNTLFQNNEIAESKTPNNTEVRSPTLY